MSNLPWFMDLTFQVPTLYCSLFTPPASFPLLAQLLLSSWSYIIIVLHSSLGNFQPEGLIFQCHIFLLFHTVHRGLTSEILEWFAIPSSSGPCFVRIALWPVHLSGPTQCGSEFHRVMQALLPWQVCDPWRGSVFYWGINVFVVHLFMQQVFAECLLCIGHSSRS